MRRVASFIISVIIIPVLYVLSIVGIIMAGLLYPFGRKARLAFVDFYYRWWHSALLASTLSSVKVFGNRNTAGETVAYYVNHASYVDICVMSANIDNHASYMAKRSLLWLLPIGFWIIAGDGVLVERKGTRRELEAILLIIDRLKKGRSFIIFPEGTRTRTGRLGEIKIGSIKIPQKARVPIVPVRIEGTAKILPRKTKWFSTGEVAVTIGEPISPEEIDEDKEKVLDKLRSHLSGE